LVRAPDLHTVAIVDAIVDESTLQPLKSMPRIASLEFRYVRLSPELCDMIMALPIRLSLNLMGTGVASEKVDQMRAALPGLAIDYKQGGFLGVVCFDNDQVCQIERIVSGGAAEAAGLIPQDVIVGIGSAKVQRFKDLQAAINQHLPGDEVEVRFVRGSQLKTVSLRLRKLEEK
jgi:S1-C subfamily serine protease